MQANPETGLKVCAACCVEKPVQEFYVLRSAPDGLQYRCKLCVDEANRLYRERDPAAYKAKKNASRAAWRRQNRERDRAAQQRWRAKHAEAIKAYQRERYRANKARFKAQRDVYVSKNRGSILEKARAYRAKNKEKVRLWGVKSRYGLTPEALAALRVTQNDICPGCLLPLTTSSHVDHDHTTGKVRGILCGTCNPCIGLGKDDSAVLRRLADYLDSHSAPLNGL
jgi:hypothetical protein